MSSRWYSPLVRMGVSRLGGRGTRLATKWKLMSFEPSQLVVVKNHIGLLPTRLYTRYAIDWVWLAAEPPPIYER
jgi:hypothetical protein